MGFKSGFIAVVGRANVGKSTLVIALVGHKVAIVSDKAQTTRDRIQGIVTTDDYQMIFLDTPGMHKPKNKLDQRMKNIILNSLEEVDLVLYLIDISQGYGPGDAFMMDIVDKKKTIFIANKIDKLSQKQTQDNLKEIEGIDEFLDCMALSAIDPNTLDGLKKKIVEHLPEGPKYFFEEENSDREFRFHVTEVIREKMLNYLDKEVPHGVAVVLNSYNTRNDILYIQCDIIVEKESHKAIIIGKNGRKIKGIGKVARLELEDEYSQKIMLELYVKVRKNWRDSQTRLQEFGYSDE